MQVYKSAINLSQLPSHAIRVIVYGSLLVALVCGVLTLLLYDVRCLPL